MANLPLTENTTEEKAQKLYNTHIDDFERTIAKVSDKRVLQAVYLLAHQKDQDKILKAINRRAKVLKISLS